MFKTIDVTHTSTFQTTDTNGIVKATREYLGKTLVEKQYALEGFNLMNTWILDGNASMPAEGAIMYGTYSMDVSPRGDVRDFNPVENLADVSYEQFYSDRITLQILNSWVSPKTTLKQIDGSISATNIEAAVQGKNTMAIVRAINNEVYKVIYNGMNNVIHPQDGLNPYIYEVPTSSSASDITLKYQTLLKAAVRLTKMPSDPYVQGFNKPEIRFVLTPEFEQEMYMYKLLVPGSVMMQPMDAWQNGFAGYGSLAGYGYVTSIFMPEGVEAMILTPGEYSMLLMQVSINAYAEIVQGSGGAVASYVYTYNGIQTAPQFAHYGAILKKGAKDVIYTTELKNLSSVKENNTSSSIKFSFTPTTIGSGKKIFYKVFRVGTKADSFDNQSFVEATGLTAGTKKEIEVTGLKAGSRYKVVIGVGDAVPSSKTSHASDYEIYTYSTTLG